ncbi:TPA: single-stranded DNA-binding protein, partial [Enterococcus faecalis]|nr:single-stranded DNA-binding protein [Enterococcus faecalis]HBD0890763.1 single-stranded DNA-binding protein [Enterococcus faecalis]HBD0894169.1 single-stranded DNA-binding protein [Enterococcus faecalis]HBI3763303.1 single-stranded DNA-binding protein [Enterococcus faecalis]HBI3763315.1 single-stranded DNA-binding protein [Enterococcus faecalis]
MIKTSAVGRLTKSSELRVTSTGKAVANFALACKRERLDKDGNAQTTFIQCVIWGKPAEVLAKYTQKGSLIAVNGELQSRSYDDQQGQTHYVTELVVAGFE